MQQQAGELRGELAKALQQLREAQMAEEQAVKSFVSEQTQKNIVILSYDKREQQVRTTTVCTK